jgi:hypothetical protein
MGTRRAKVLSASHADPVYSGSFMTEKIAGTRVLHRSVGLRYAPLVRWPSRMSETGASTLSSASTAMCCSLLSWVAIIIIRRQVLLWYGCFVPFYLV